jgi:hypothetical protein
VREEASGLHPILPEDAPCSGRGRNGRPRRLYPPAQVAQLQLRDALVRLPRVVGDAARDLEEAELPRRGLDLLRVLAFVRAAERDPRLEPRPRLGRVTSGPSRASVSAPAEGTLGLGGSSNRHGPCPSLCPTPSSPCDARWSAAHGARVSSGTANG